ncbi:DNA polymerase elongation subunit (family B) [Pantoea dispersa]|nr:DNA polymerase elongation subunit (family B) [Pantoea dispersa]
MTDLQQNSAQPEAAAVSKQRIWAIVGASSGNLVEWFDFYVYSFF